jgi:hypothetical protein
MKANDTQVAGLIANPATSIPGVVAVLRGIDELLDGASDGLKWFNSLYLQVTLAVEQRVNAQDFDTPQGTGFIAALDVVFANFYLSALRNWLAGREAPRSWCILFAQRSNLSLARIQFALAGVNAHINRDLAFAIASTCAQAKIAVSHTTPEYRAYTALNATLDSLIERAKRELMVSLPGDSLPAQRQLEAVVAAWSVAAAREAAWVNGEILSRLAAEPALANRLVDTLDGAAELAGRGLLIQF